MSEDGGMKIDADMKKRLALRFVDGNIERNLNRERRRVKGNLDDELIDIDIRGIKADLPR